MNKPVMVRFDEEVLKRVTRLAKENGLSREAYIRQCVERADLSDLIRDIYEAVRKNGNKNGNNIGLTQAGTDALEFLVGTGNARRWALERIRLALEQNPKATVDEIIHFAHKEKSGG